MKLTGNFIIQSIVNIVLIIGCIYGYWNFSATMFVFMFELLALIAIGFVFLLLPSSKGQPGPILFGGGIIISICLLTTWLLAHNLGEIEQYSNGNAFAYTFKQYVADVSLQVWPVYLIASLGIGFTFFKHKKSSKHSNLQVMLFRRIFTLFGVIIFSVVVMHFLNTYNHIIIIVCLIIAKFLTELLLQQKTANEK